MSAGGSGMGVSSFAYGRSVVHSVGRPRLGLVYPPHEQAFMKNIYSSICKRQIQKKKKKWQTNVMIVKNTSPLSFAWN